MISDVIVWSNGMLMVFDESGAQMPEYQGPFREQLSRVLAVVGDQVRWQIGDWRNGTVQTTREALECMAKEKSQ